MMTLIVSCNGSKTNNQINGIVITAQDNLSVVKEEETLQLYAEVISLTFFQEVKWNSSDGEVATVYDEGLGLCVRAGMVKILATSVEDESITQSFALIVEENLLEVTLYKASHHGYHGSNLQELLNILNQKAVAISAAKANQYTTTPTGPSQNNTYNLNAASGHPAAEAISRIYKAPNISRNLNVYWNAVNGTMKFCSYGEDDFIFTGSTPLKCYYDLSLTNGQPIWNSTLNDFENKVRGEENFKLHQN